MSANEIHVNDIGTQFVITVQDGDDIIDVSEASTKQLIFYKPDKSVLTKNASFYNDGEDGIISYITVDGDLDQDGIWQLQGYLVIGSASWYTDISKFTVRRNLQE